MPNFSYQSRGRKVAVLKTSASHLPIVALKIVDETKAGMERSAMTEGVRCSPSFHFVPFRLLLTPPKLGHTPQRITKNKNSQFVPIGGTMKPSRQSLFMNNFLELSSTELAKIVDDWQLPAYRITQIRRWIFARKVTAFEQMTDLPKSVRTLLSEHFGTILSGNELSRLQSDDSTQKLLIEWNDGERIECVLLQNHRHHRTACVSTQVGCAMRCAFCASGMDGFVRNLTRGEILEQLLRLNALLSDNERLTHVVVMGIGEPLLNLDALLSALDEATSTDGLDISVRRVTISTVGIPAGIRKLAEAVVQSGKGYKLAVSLHAPNDELRSQFIPYNRSTSIAEILSATDEYFGKTGRRVTFEYTLLKGVNDHQEHVAQLADLLRKRTAIVNVIPLNPVLELGFRAPSSGAVLRFVEQLEESGIQVKVRFRRGNKIAAACGQLRRCRLSENLRLP